jgi:hypothetical protein
MDEMTQEEHDELEASVGSPICPHCGEEIDLDEADELAERLGRDVCPNCLE